ncbi:DUF3048 domain-containing protein [Paenibacillus protaetiae]|uniref:DUF3048 domain-containing protein n=1 Tax=Paenibacillus protaetiae TaxID=2509456 RepID=A0A4P6EVG2_9BACL|nr:DUF3048 domain-containing protein [Paenibacillus protaetiae]QAY67022.1 DUF3048 domain-containing protein [Paenibacillus protaetiae]
MKKNRRFLFILWPAVMSVLLLLAACASSGSNEAPSPAPEATATVSPSAEPVPTEPPMTAPLTGIGRDTPADARPIGVMINNLAPARPQSGLTNADVVWEVLAEGGITRLVAIFQSTDKMDDPVGPIRSIRPYFIDLIESYGGIIAHAGGSNDAYAILQTQHKPDLDEITNAGSYFWRSKDRKAPHNLYSDLGKLKTAAAKKKYGPLDIVPAYSFDAAGAVADTDKPAGSISIRFMLKNYTVRYEYDAGSGIYKRFIGDEPHIDMNNNEQLSAANLVVLSTKHETLDDEGRLAVDMKSGGPAVLFQKGKALDCEWTRAADGMIRIMKDGKELPFIPGHTYFHIVPNDKPLEQHVTYG